jgi:hypothetical protein
MATAEVVGTLRSSEESFALAAQLPQGDLVFVLAPIPA